MKKWQENFHSSLPDLNSKPADVLVGMGGRVAGISSWEVHSLAWQTHPFALFQGLVSLPVPLNIWQRHFLKYEWCPTWDLPPLLKLSPFHPINAFSPSQISLLPLPSWKISPGDSKSQVASHSAHHKMESSIPAISLSTYWLEERWYVDSWGQRTSTVISHTGLQFDFFIFKKIVFACPRVP